MLAHLGPMLAPSWAYVGPSWGYVGPSWTYVGAMFSAKLARAQDATFSAPDLLSGPVHGPAPGRI